jgi:hypothetical protein
MIYWDRLTIALDRLTIALDRLTIALDRLIPCLRFSFSGRATVTAKVIINPQRAAALCTKTTG